MSLEHKLYNAYVQGTGCRLTAEDIQQLIGPDNAIRVRITNTAALEAGIPEPGFDEINPNETWNQLKQRLWDYNRDE